MSDTKEEALSSQGKDDEGAGASGNQASAEAGAPVDGEKGRTEGTSKVQKTLLEYKLPDVDALVAGAANNESNDAAHHPDNAGKSGGSHVVHKTLIDQEVRSPDPHAGLTSDGSCDPGAVAESSAAANGSVPEMPPPPPPELAHHHDGPKVHKTMLDHNVLWDTVAKAAAEMEVKVAEQIKERANEPVKPFQEITKYKMATACESVWEENNPKERFRYCGLCQLHVYDFSGLELPEAEELIFKRENRKNAPLFKRADGKFLTSDCPVAIKKKRNFVMSVIGGIVLVALVLGLLLAMPKPPQPTTSDKPQNQGPTDWTPDQETGSKSTTGTAPQTGGAIQPSAGGTQPATGTTQPATQAPAKDQSNQANDGYWQYSSDPATEAPAPAQQTYTPQPSYAPAQPQQQAPNQQQAPQEAQSGAGQGSSDAQPAAGSDQSKASGIQYYGR
jgi:hypothetical protein